MQFSSAEDRTHFGFTDIVNGIISGLLTLLGDQICQCCLIFLVVLLWEFKGQMNASRKPLQVSILTSWPALAELELEAGAVDL